MAMLEEEELKDAILLVFANKQDQRGALNARHVRPTLSQRKVIFAPEYPTRDLKLMEVVCCVMFHEDAQFGK
jgi:hypothetical protein